MKAIYNITILILLVGCFYLIALQLTSDKLIKVMEERIEHQDTYIKRIEEGYNDLFERYLDILFPIK